MFESSGESENNDALNSYETQGGNSQSANLQDQVEEICSDALSIARRKLGMSIGFVAQFSAGHRVVKAVDHEGQVSVFEVGHSDPLEESYCQRVVDGRLPNLINDALEYDPARELAVTETLPVRAHASVPICFSDGSIYGTFCCFSTEAGKDFNEDDLAVMSVFAEFTGRQIERAQTRYSGSRTLKRQIRSILDNHEMHPVFQPIIHIGEQRIIGYEALTRFDVEPYAPPNVWFDAAKTVGLQTELEIAAVHGALQHLDQIPKDCYVSVNVSPETLVHPSFPDHMKAYPLDRLLIELTEHVFVSDYRHFKKQLRSMRIDGIQLAIDDVGAGYSSLRHILELNPEIIKLDRSLITEIDKRFDLMSMAKALVGFATDMGIKVVAEGIETKEELTVLDELGVIKAQGYLLGKPQTIERLKRNE